MARKLIDLSMEVHKEMVVYGGVTPPFISQVHDHKDYARITGTDKLGIDHCNTGIIIMGDHVGTHVDSWWHANPDAPGGTEAIPIEYCYGDGVVLDLTHKGPGDEITVKVRSRAGAGGKLFGNVKTSSLVIENGVIFGANAVVSGAERGAVLSVGDRMDVVLDL